MNAGKTLTFPEALISKSAVEVLRGADLVLADASFLMWRHWSPPDEDFYSSAGFDAHRYHVQKERHTRAANSLFRILPEALRSVDKVITVHPDVRRQMSSLQRKNFQAGTERGRNAEAAAATGSLRLSRLAGEGLVQEWEGVPPEAVPAAAAFRRQPWMGQVIARAMKDRKRPGPLRVAVLTQDHALAGEISRKQLQSERSAHFPLVTCQALTFDYHHSTLVPREHLGKTPPEEVQAAPSTAPGLSGKKESRLDWTLWDRMEHWAFVLATMAAIFLPFLLLPRSSASTSPPLTSFFVKSVRFDPTTGSPLIYDSPTHPEISIRIDLGSAALNLAADMTGLSGLHWERFRLVPELGPVALARSAPQGSLFGEAGASRGVTFVPWPGEETPATGPAGWSLFIRNLPE